VQKNRLTQYFAEMEQEQAARQVAVCDPEEDSTFRSPALRVRRPQPIEGGLPPLGLLALVGGGLLALLGVGLASKGLVIAGAASMIAGGMDCISTTENRRG